MLPSPVRTCGDRDGGWAEGGTFLAEGDLKQRVGSGQVSKAGAGHLKPIAGTFDNSKPPGISSYTCWYKLLIHKCV